MLQSFHAITFVHLHITYFYTHCKLAQALYTIVTIQLTTDEEGRLPRKPDESKLVVSAEITFAAFDRDSSNGDVKSMSAYVRVHWRLAKVLHTIVTIKAHGRLKRLITT